MAIGEAPGTKAEIELETTVAFEGEPAPAPFVWRDDVNPLIVETIAAKIR